MRKLKVTIAVALLILTAVLVSPGWVKDLSTEKSEKPAEVQNLTVKGMSIDNSMAGMYSFKLATSKYEQFY
ncbi:MAG: hypothetical protein IPL53_17505 [Ignavibacteria bacterium]|nr:hypothetical protein [Ignavibacteria bacterium]